MVPESEDETLKRDSVLGERNTHAWTSLFGSKLSIDNFGVLVVLSVFVTTLWFVLLYLVSVPLGLQAKYIDPTTVVGSAAYFFALMLGIELVIIAHWLANRRRSWERIVTCFVDQKGARKTIARGLGWQRDFRLVLILFVSYNLTIPFWIHDLHPLTDSSHLLFFVINASVVLPTAVISYFLICHLVLVRAVLRLDLRSVHSAARAFDPLVRFSTRAATGWFTLITLYVVYLYYLTLVADFESGSARVFSAAGLDVVLRLVETPPNVPFYPEPSGYLSTIVLFMMVGFSVFFLPIWMVHTKVKTTKRERLIEIEEKYDEVIRRWSEARELESEVAVELDRIDRVHAAATRVRTWPSDVESVGKLFVASAIPVLQMVVIPIYKLLVSSSA